MDFAAFGRMWRPGSRRADLRDAVVLVTGGSRGLGLELARTFGAQGARVALAARDADELERARHDLEARGVTVSIHACDVTSPGDAERAVAEVVERFGSVDVLVNDAGIISVGPMDAMNAGDYEASLATHFWGPFRMIAAVLPAMRERKRGRIVNIVSIGGRISVPHLMPYSVGKFALAGYSEGLRAELARDGVFVTTVFPGLMRTGSPERARFKARNRLEYAWFTISDSLPLLSVDVTAAARTIVRATERGTADVVISLPAQIGAVVHGIVPGFVAELLSLVAAILPGMGGIGTSAREGVDSHSRLTESPLTAATQERAVTQNEIA